MRTSFDFARAHVLRSLLVLTAVTLIGGCGIFSPDEGGETPVDPPAPWVLAETPEQFAINFRRCWEERNIEEYENLLSENFIFRLSSADIDEGEVGFWGRAQEIRTAEFMFGIESTPPELTVESIEFTRWEINLPWTGEVNDPQFEDAEFVATYTVELTATIAGDPEPVKGNQRLYIKREAITVDGEEVSVFRLRAWEDLGTTVN